MRCRVLGLDQAHAVTLESPCFTPSTPAVPATSTSAHFLTAAKKRRDSTVNEAELNG
jgi:hypothetical protein